MEKLIHGLWHDGDFASKGNYSETWKKYNPDARIKIWTFAEIEQFLPEYPLLQKIYPMMEHIGQISDILRFMVMDKFGGIYMDLDVECLKPLDALFEEEVFFSFAPPPHIRVSNAIFGAKRPGFPIWSAMIHQYVKYFRREANSLLAVNASGSILVGRLVQKHLLLPKCKSPEILLPYHRTQYAEAMTIHHSTKSWVNKTYRRTHG